MRIDLTLLSKKLGENFVSDLSPVYSRIPDFEKISGQKWVGLYSQLKKKNTKKKTKIKAIVDSWLLYSPSLKHPIRYKVGILMTKAKMSSMKVFRALYVNIRHGR